MLNSSPPKKGLRGENPYKPVIDNPVNKFFTTLAAIAS